MNSYLFQPVLSVPPPVAGYFAAAGSLLTLATQLESRISENLREAPGIGHAYVSTGGGISLVVLEGERLGPADKQDLRRISSEAFEHLKNPNPFLAGMAARIKYAANMAGFVSERNALAYLLRPASSPDKTLYSALSYALTDAEKGLAYFFGLHFLPVFKDTAIPYLVEKPYEVGFGVTAALSLFTDKMTIEDLRAKNGFFNPNFLSETLRRTDEGYLLEPQ